MSRGGSPGRDALRGGRSATEAWRMRPRVTNLRSRVVPGSPALSVVEVESTQLPRRVEVAAVEPGALALRLWGLRLNMDPYERPVCDGLIRRLWVRHAVPDGVECRLALEFPAALCAPRVETEAGIPACTRLLLSREPVRRTLGGRVVVVDPAHGGPDRGARGPINLEERHVVLKVAARLAHHLQEAGCRVHLTRQDDREVPPARRVLTALASRAELFISLHTGHEPAPRCRGVRTLYGSSGAGSRERARDLASSVHTALVEWLGLPDRGVAAAGPSDSPPGLLTCRWPLTYLAVEVVCLANPLDEALLRSSVFRDRLAQAIRNGLVRHHAHGAARGEMALAV